MARYYVAALPREKPVLRAKWHSELDKESISEIRRYIEQLQQPRTASG